MEIEKKIEMGQERYVTGIRGDEGGRRERRTTEGRSREEGQGPRAQREKKGGTNNWNKVRHCSTECASRDAMLGW